MTTAAIIREMLDHAGLTQTELARRLGLSRISVVRWCTGAVDPSATALLRIASECGYSLRKTRERKPR